MPQAAMGRGQEAGPAHTHACAHSPPWDLVTRPSLDLDDEGGARGWKQTPNHPTPLSLGHCGGAGPSCSVSSYPSSFECTKSPG